MVAGLQRSVRLYYALTFSMTALVWMVGGAVSSRTETGTVYALGLVAGAAVPFFVAIGITLISGNPDLRRDFASRIVDLGLLKPDTLPAVLLLMPMVVVTSLLLSLLLGEPVSQFLVAKRFSMRFGVLPAVFVSLIAAAFQELGWRGYAFPGIRNRYGPATASLVFGGLWALWHLPLLFVAGTHPYEALQASPWYAANFYLAVVPIGVLISWFSAVNGGSVLAATLFHFSVVLSQEVLALTYVTRAVETVILAVVAAVAVATVPLERREGSLHSSSDY